MSHSIYIGTNLVHHRFIEIAKRVKISTSDSSFSDVSERENNLTTETSSCIFYQALHNYSSAISRLLQFFLSFRISLNSLYISKRLRTIRYLVSSFFQIPPNILLISIQISQKSAEWRDYSAILQESCEFRPSFSEHFTKSASTKHLLRLLITKFLSN